MKKLILTLAAASIALAGRAALPQPDLIAQIHFIGGNQVAADKNYPAFANEFSSPEAMAMRKEAADKLAPWLAGWLQAKLGTSVPAGAAQLRPLFDDLQTAEWFMEARGTAGGRPDVAIAIKLDPAHMQLWLKGLKPFFPAATFKQSAGWLLFDSGTDTVRAGDDLARKILMPSASWLSVDVNWPHLAQWFPNLKELALPETLFDVTAPGNQFVINGRFLFPENLSMKLDAWQFPSNSVHQPLTSFTAVRGFAGWLNGQDWAPAWKLSPPANQLFTWAMKGLPYFTFAAVPVADSTDALRQLGADLQPVIADRNANGGFIAPATLDETSTQLTLEGLPMIAPYITALKAPAGQFLLAGVYPNSTKSRPLPPGLFQQLALPGLVFYHWEITGERLSDLLQSGQLALLVTQHRQLETESAAFRWVSKIAPAMGNTVTRITQIAPDQFAFNRSTPGGLTAFEFLILADWLGAADFPHYNLDSVVPERLKRLRAKHLQVMSVPAPAQPH